MAGQLKIFLSYSHKDKNYKDMFLAQFSSLRRTENISIWTDAEINAGTFWNNEISQKLCEAHVVIILVSANFIASEYIYNSELKKALELQEKKQTAIIPVLLSNCSITGIIEHIETLPTDPRFVEAWPNENDAWVNVIEGIRKSIKKIIEDLKIWDPVSARENIMELLKQSNKLEDACNQTIDFAVNYGQNDQDFEAINIRTKLSDIEQASEKRNAESATFNASFLDILNARQQLRMEIFKLINAIMADLSKQASSSKPSGRRA